MGLHTRHKSLDLEWNIERSPQKKAHEISCASNKGGLDGGFHGGGRAISWQDRRSSQIRRSEPAQVTPHKKGYRISDADGDERDAKKQDKHQNDVERSGNDEVQHGIPPS
jgi:hypothetical protein